eukprot:gnl/TRDRNA2_/TRDRNA2_127849_c0_seq1.p1 gnl/TRDRNA2_/TRDRNA2_127849_c0~~gnl/TRDRNA2_/TRDRNA2_127849_c0_seq1.p1  ORF type:complete len:137 (+),score=20.05 gnl/TRDRNA2_/TRDRNA2_127849_c0_seq1:42-413(+)
MVSFRHQICAERSSRCTTPPPRQPATWIRPTQDAEMGVFGGLAAEKGPLTAILSSLPALPHTPSHLKMRQSCSPPPAPHPSRLCEMYPLRSAILCDSMKKVQAVFENDPTAAMAGLSKDSHHT